MTYSATLQFALLKLAPCAVDYKDFLHHLSFDHFLVLPRYMVWLQFLGHQTEMEQLEEVVCSEGLSDALGSHLVVTFCVNQSADLHYCVRATEREMRANSVIGVVLVCTI